MILHRKTALRGNLRLEIKNDSLTVERRGLRGVHTFEAPLSELQPTMELVRATSFGNWALAAALALIAGAQFSPGEEVHGLTFVVSALFALGATYFAILAWIGSGEYSIVRSTKETSRDI